MGWASGTVPTKSRLYARLVPVSKNPSGDRPDLRGALLSTIGMAAVVYAIVSRPEHGWTSARVLLTAFTGAAVLTGGLLAAVLLRRAGRGQSAQADPAATAA